MYHGEMATMAPEKTSRRRSQAERRAATRVALLDATVACLVEQGYARTTTRTIAERAGVTPGALQHHFGSKPELLSAALGHIAEQLVKETSTHGADTTLPIGPRTELFLDRMWALFKGPLFQAGTELWVAARTERELRESLFEVQRFGTRAILAAGPLLYPELAGRPGLSELIETGQAALRGLALLRLIDPQDADRVWPATRAHLLALTAAFNGESGAP
jgi:AcrR family transcriptional regulator